MLRSIGTSCIDGEVLPGAGPGGWRSGDGCAPLSSRPGQRRLSVAAYPNNRLADDPVGSWCDGCSQPVERRALTNWVGSSRTCSSLIISLLGHVSVDSYQPDDDAAPEEYRLPALGRGVVPFRIESGSKTSRNIETTKRFSRLRRQNDRAKFKTPKKLSP